MIISFVVCQHLAGPLNEQSEVKYSDLRYLWLGDSSNSNTSSVIYQESLE